MSILMTPAYLNQVFYPSWHTRIGWENQARDAVITVNDTVAGTSPYAPISDQTFEWWQPVNLPAYWAAEFTTPTIINYVGIAVHEIGSTACTVQVQYNIGAGWIDVADATVTPIDDGAIMILFEDIICDAMRIYITGAGVCPRIGIVYMGKILEMERPVRWMGHVPARFNRDFEKRPNTSERGQRLGVSLIRQSISAQFEVHNLDEDWARNTFDEFIVNSMRYGYFISWRPTQFPDEVYFGWSDSPIIPSDSQSGINRKMSVSWNMNCYTPENIQAWES